MNEIFQEEYFKPYIFDLRRTASYREQIDWISNFSSLEHCKILDYGCGTGEMMKILNSRKALTFGCDVSSYAIKICKDKSLNCKLITNGLIPFKEKFDLVIMRGVFQHLRSPNDVMQQLYSHLKPGGFIAILSTPNIESISYILFHDLPTLTKAKVKNLPSKSSVEHCLNLNGFEIVAHRYPYLKSGYARPHVDFMKFLLKLLRFGKDVPTFKGNVIEMIGKKC